MAKHLKKFRLILAWLMFSVVVMAFFGVITAKPIEIQLLPALLAANILALGIILLLTILFGRIYCSVICPLGIWQDVLIFFGNKRKGANKRGFAPAHTKIRLAVLAIFAVSLVAGVAAVPIFLDPYSIFGRFMTNLFAPALELSVNNLQPFLYEHGIDILNKYDFVFMGEAALATAAAYFIVISLLAFFRGRLYCNAFCPVGTLLSVFSRRALFKPHFEDNCISCKMCERKCPANCIDVGSKTIDYSRCVSCFDCMAACPKGAMDFGIAAKKIEDDGTAVNLSRRELIVTSAVAALGAVGALTKTGRSAAIGTAPEKVSRPPGAINYGEFSQKCTACHLCVERCPNGIIKPANLEYGLGGIFQPRLDFTYGYCSETCNECGKACPSGAIKEIALDKKTTFMIGKAVYDKESCLVTTKGARCGACSWRCPVHAIEMTPAEDGRSYPKVSHKLCIGCGACEYHCPASPKAMRVHGIEEQHEKGKGKKNSEKNADNI